MVGCGGGGAGEITFFVFSNTSHSAHECLDKVRAVNDVIRHSDSLLTTAAYCLPSLTIPSLCFSQTTSNDIRGKFLVLPVPRALCCLPPAYLCWLWWFFFSFLLLLLFFSTSTSILVLVCCFGSLSPPHKREKEMSCKKE